MFGYEIVTLTRIQTLTRKTLTAPTIAATDWANANHAHAAANSGGQIGYASLTDIPATFAPASHAHSVHSGIGANDHHNQAHTVASADHSDWPAGLDVTELGYVNGVTSAIQTQLGTKAPLASPSFTGNVTVAGSIYPGAGGAGIDKYNAEALYLFGVAGIASANYSCTFYDTGQLNFLFTGAGNAWLRGKLTQAGCPNPLEFDYLTYLEAQADKAKYKPSADSKGQWLYRGKSEPDWTVQDREAFTQEFMISPGEMATGLAFIVTKLMKKLGVTYQELVAFA